MSLYVFVKKYISVDHPYELSEIVLTSEIRVSTYDGWLHWWLALVMGVEWCLTSRIFKGVGLLSFCLSKFFCLLGFCPLQFRLRRRIPIKKTRHSGPRSIFVCCPKRAFLAFPTTCLILTKYNTIQTKFVVSFVHPKHP